MNNFVYDYTNAIFKYHYNLKDNDELLHLINMGDKVALKEMERRDRQKSIEATWLNHPPDNNQLNYEEMTSEEIARRLKRKPRDSKAETESRFRRQQHLNNSTRVFENRIADVEQTKAILQGERPWKFETEQRALFDSLLEEAQQKYDFLSAVEQYHLCVSSITILH